MAVVETSIPRTRLMTRGGQPPEDQMTRLTRFSSSSWRPDTGAGSSSPDRTLASSDSRLSPPSRMPVPSPLDQPA
jgi:hypothetical protein